MVLALALLVLFAGVLLFVHRAGDRGVVVRAPAADVAGVPQEAWSTAPRDRRTQRGAQGNAAREEAVPAAGDFEGCPVAGDGGDRSLNTLKNRVSLPAPPRDVPLDSLLALSWPSDAGDRTRSRWSATAGRIVARQEVRGVRTIAYVAMARLSGPESTNCHGDDSRYRDYHVWLTSTAGLGRERSLIAEMTPRFRAQHAGWTVTRLGDISRRRERVRVTGWLLLDQEHPEQVGRTRGTLWEIHPVTGFEVWQGNRWVPLDSVDGRRGAR